MLGPLLSFCEYGMTHLLTTLLLQLNGKRSKPRKSLSQLLRLLERRHVSESFFSFYFHLSHISSSIDRKRMYGRNHRGEEVAYCKRPVHRAGSVILNLGVLLILRIRLQNTALERIPFLQKPYCLTLTALERISACLDGFGLQIFIYSLSSSVWFLCKSYAFCVVVYR